MTKAVKELPSHPLLEQIKQSVRRKNPTLYEKLAKAQDQYRQLLVALPDRDIGQFLYIVKARSSLSYSHMPISVRDHLRGACIHALARAALAIESGASANHCASVRSLHGAQ